MKINKLLIIPDYNQIEKSIFLADKYGCGFEYNDFFLPDFLEDEKSVDRRVDFYRGRKDMPDYCTMHGAFMDVTVASDDPRIVAVSDYRIEQSLQIARRLGVKAVVFHTNFIANFGADYYKMSWLERNVAFFSEKLEKYYDIDIYIENMFDMSCELLAELAQKLSHFSNFGICFDYAHANVFGKGQSLNVWISKLAPYIKHVHINDNDLTDDLHLPLGDGAINWEYFKAVYETHFSQASVLIEVKGLDGVEKSLQFIEKL